MARACSALALASLLIVPAANAGTISGKARYGGPATPPRHVQMAADAECDRLNPGGRDLETLTVADDGGLANVVVSIKSGLDPDLKFAAPVGDAVLDQRRCTYVPHVLVIQTGQTLEIRNSDATFHNVHAAPAGGEPFSAAMPALNQVIKKKFDSRDVAVRMRCDVHPWMSAYVAVVENPFFAVSRADGTFSIPNVPPGEYTLEAWHESLGVQTLTVEVDDDEPTKTDLLFAGK